MRRDYNLAAVLVQLPFAQPARGRGFYAGGLNQKYSRFTFSCILQRCADELLLR